MDSIDNINNVNSYNKTQGVSAYNGISNVVNQLNKDNSNTFNNQLANKMQKLLTGEIIDLKSNEIIVRLDDGTNISAQIYDTTNLSIGQTIKFHLQDNKGVLILEPLKESIDSSGNLINKALEAAHLPITDKNISLVTELLKNNMSLDSQSINNIVQQSNFNKDISVETLVLMNKHNIPINEENAVEISKYRNYEHRLIKEIDNISNDVPKLINSVSKSSNYETLIDFNSKLVNILTSNGNKNTQGTIPNNIETTNNFNSFNINNFDNVSNSVHPEPTVFPSNNLPGITDIAHNAPLLNDSINRLSSPNMISGDDNSNNSINVGHVYSSNPDVAVAYLKPSSAQELLTILEPYNVPEEILHGIKDGTAPLRDVADVIHKAMEIADELDEYRVSDYNADQQGYSSVEYGTVSARVSREMGFIDSYANLDAQNNANDKSNINNTLPNQSSTNNGYVNISLAKDAFEHPVIKNILEKYEILQRDNSEVASFQNFYNRGQLTSKLRDIPNSSELADRIWKGNISANELLLEINNLIDNADPSDITKLLNSDQYQSVVKEAIINNWTISPNALKQKDIVKDTYDNMYHQLNELQSFISKLSLDKTVTEHLSKEIAGTKSNINFMNTINNMFSYVQLPLKLREQNVHSDLYVMTNKQKLQRDKNNISVLLHLDMQYLGTMDININLSGNVVNTKFHVTDDYTQELLSKNMEQLEYAMLEKGFILSSSVDLKEKEVNLVTDFLSSESPTTSIKRYTFDMRG